LNDLKSYKEACDFLFDLKSPERDGLASLNMKLDTMRNLLAAIDNPEAEFNSVHVAGTNGKGSTCSFLSAILTAHGFKTGLHTSPHLFSFSERMRIDGVPAPEEWIIKAANKMKTAIIDSGASFFEASTAMSFLYFAERKVDYAIIEVGLGGRLDATNVIQPMLCLITVIDIDHTEKLGSTKEAIAVEKAGIIKRKTTAILADQNPAVRNTIATIALEKRAPLFYLDELIHHEDSHRSLRTDRFEYEPFLLGINGKHQAQNAALAVAASERIIEPSPAKTKKALLEVKELSGLPHNLQGFSTGIDWFLENAKPEGQRHIIFGVSEDKDYEGMLAKLRGTDSIIYPVQAEIKRSLAIRNIEDVASKQGLTSKVISSSVLKTVEEILKHCPQCDSLYIGGSHYVVGEIPKPLFDQFDQV